jgi:hypothetical protein
MKSVDEIKADVRAVNSYWSKIWIGIVLALFVADVGFGYSAAFQLLLALGIPVSLFLHVKRATVAGDQIEVLSAYRTFAIIMTCAVIGVLTKTAAEREGFAISMEVNNVLFLSGGLGLLGLTLYDRYFARGDAE